MRDYLCKCARPVRGLSRTRGCCLGVLLWAVYCHAYTNMKLFLKGCHLPKSDDAKLQKRKASMPLACLVALELKSHPSTNAAAAERLAMLNKKFCPPPFPDADRVHRIYLPVLG